MNRTMLQGQLARAERHVLEGERRVARQREIVAALTGDAEEFGRAKALLEKFEQIQDLYIADRDRLRKELGL